MIFPEANIRFSVPPDSVFQHTGPRLLYAVIACVRAPVLPRRGRVGGKTRIRVESIQGAVLLLSAEDDTMWPSYEAARRIVRRLEDGGFQYPVIERAYHRAGHYLFPVESRWHKLFANARRYP